jgi:hypothetical protein
LNLVPKRKLPQDDSVSIFGDTITRNTITNTADLTPAHKDATTGVHGVGAGTVAKTSDIPSAGSTPSTQVYGDSANGGSATTWSKNDHKHGFPTHTASQTVYSAGGARTLSSVDGDNIYQNTSGKVMFITVSVGATDFSTIAGYSAANTPPTTLITYATVDASRYISQTFIVPAGNYYKVYGANNLTNFTLYKWTEWTIG